jgi:uncharacterized LabA/DUF88 family protein
MRKEYILIDGENFTHKLVGNLKAQKLIRTRSQLTKINIKKLLDFASNAKIQYYTTEIRVSKYSKLFKKADLIRKWNSRWVPYLKNQGVEFIKAGFLRVRDGKRCVKCGAKSEVLIEKGVDVRLAVDIVSLADNNSMVYLLSSDTDLLPAIEKAVDKGTEVVYVSFYGDDVISLRKVVTRTITLANSKIKKVFEDVS